MLRRFAEIELARGLLCVDDMPRVPDTEGKEREKRLTNEDGDGGSVGSEGGGREDGPDGGESLVEAVRLGLEGQAGAAGLALTPEGQVRDDVLLRRLRDFICGASVKEGWRG